jgi:alkanesulfonate monooxygenase SsuD/methylene tetrahydromethanopterin reductase-like flavin-dependent oxidoreductase (luciferase family)
LPNAVLSIVFVRLLFNQFTMQFGLDVPTTGDYADARVLAGLAADAEASGWDGFFIWDVLLGDRPVIDPWIALTAIALQTARIRIGLMVTPLARHRPWLVARRLANLDQLSGGRVVCTVGLGHSERDFSAFGETSEATVRGARLDESLTILAGLWREENFSFAGQHYTLDQVTVRPKPVQSPRIPLWVAGGWPRRPPFRRAARWDGAAFKSVHHDERRWLTLDEFGEGVAYLRAMRTSTKPFDVLMSGELPEDRPAAREQVAAFEAAGATWWVEEGLGWSLEEFRQRIRGGPPGR